MISSIGIDHDNLKDILNLPHDKPFLTITVRNEETWSVEMRKVTDTYCQLYLDLDHDLSRFDMPPNVDEVVIRWTMKDEPMKVPKYILQHQWDLGVTSWGDSLLVCVFIPGMDLKFHGMREIAYTMVKNSIV